MSGKKKAALGVISAIFAGLLLALVLGWSWGYALVGLGTSLGAALGIAAGNKRAAATDTYREEWLSRRRQGRAAGKRQTGPADGMHGS